MSKKNLPKKVTKEVSDGLPEEEQSWVYQPIMIAMMRNKYTKSQLKSLVAIMIQMQDAIKDVIFNNARPEDQLALFPSEDFITKFGDELIDPNKEIVMKIPLSKFKCDKRRYSKLKDDLDQLATLPFYIPIKSLDGEEYTHVSGLCEVIRPKNYDRDVYIKMKKEVALRFISTDGGSMKFLEQVVDEANHNYAMRMYFFIASWRNHEATCPRSVKWVRNWLMLENEYPRWNMFYNCVLKKAEEELYRIAVTEGKGDLYFTTKKIYDSGSEVGAPDRLQFIIHRSETGKMCDNSTAFRNQKKMISDFCHASFGFKDSDLKAILKKVTPDNIDKLNTYLVELDIEEQKRMKDGKIDKLHRHAFTCIMHRLREWESEDAEVVNSLLGQEQPMQPEKNHSSATIPELSADDQVRWGRVHQSLLASMGDLEYHQWFSGDAMQLVGISEQLITIEVPSRTYWEMVGAKYGKLIKAEIAKEWGSGYEIRFTTKA